MSAYVAKYCLNIKQQFTPQPHPPASKAGRLKTFEKNQSQNGPADMIRYGPPGYAFLTKTQRYTRLSGVSFSYVTFSRSV